MAELRSFIILDNLQEQLASFMASTVRGYMPVANMASLFVEVAPGMEIVRLLDIAVKATEVRPAIQVVERSFGTLEVHAESQADVRQAGNAVLDAMGLTLADRLKPRIASSTVCPARRSCMAVSLARKGSPLASSKAPPCVKLRSERKPLVQIAASWTNCKANRGSICSVDRPLHPHNKSQVPNRKCSAANNQRPTGLP